MPPSKRGSRGKILPLHAALGQFSEATLSRTPERMKKEGWRKKRTEKGGEIPRLKKSAAFSLPAQGAAQCPISPRAPGPPMERHGGAGARHGAGYAHACARNVRRVAQTPAAAGCRPRMIPRGAQPQLPHQRLRHHSARPLTQWRPARGPGCSSVKNQARSGQKFPGDILRRVTAHNHGWIPENSHAHHPVLLEFHF